MPNLPSLSPNALTAHLDDETVVLDLGAKRYFHLNATGQRIIALLEEGCPTEAFLVQRLCEEFEATPAMVTDQVRALLSTLREYGLVEEHTTAE